MDTINKTFCQKSAVNDCLNARFYSVLLYFQVDSINCILHYLVTGNYFENIASRWQVRIDCFKIHTTHFRASLRDIKNIFVGMANWNKFMVYQYLKTVRHCFTCYNFSACC